MGKSMTAISQSKTEQTFLKQWIFMCVVGCAIGGIVGVVVRIVPSLPPGMSQWMSDFLANFLMGGVTGGIISVFQWVVLRQFLADSKWWILAGVLGSSIGTITYGLVFPFTSRSDAARFASLMCLMAVLTIVGIALFKGYLEWLVLRKDFPNSKSWIGIRVLIGIIAVVISSFSSSIRTGTDFAILGNSLILLSEGVIQGIIFAVMTGPTLNNFIEKRGERWAA
jgi:hypothetical protein